MPSDLTRDPLVRDITLDDLTAGTLGPDWEDELHAVANHLPYASEMARRWVEDTGYDISGYRRTFGDIEMDRGLMDDAP